jgi:hypothetical protein
MSDVYGKRKEKRKDLKGEGVMIMKSKGQSFNQMKHNLLKKQSFMQKRKKVNNLFSKKFGVKMPGKTKRHKKNLHEKKITHLTANFSNFMLSNNSSPLTKKKILQIKKVGRRNNKTSLSKKIKGSGKGKLPNFLLQNIEKNKNIISSKSLLSSKKKKNFKNNYRPVNIKPYISFLDQGNSIYELKRKPKINGSLNLEKYHSKSLKKHLKNSFMQNKTEKTRNLQNIVTSFIARKTKRSIEKPENQTEKSPNNFNQYQSLESKSMSEANSLSKRQILLSKTEIDSFYPTKKSSHKVTGSANEIQNNIFYEDSPNREDHGSRNMTTLRKNSNTIQIFNNQINNYEIKISQSFPVSPDIKDHDFHQNNHDKDQFNLLLCGENSEKKVIYSNFNNQIDEDSVSQPPKKKKVKMKNYSLNFNDIYFDLPSMRNLKTSGSGSGTKTQDKEEDMRHVEQSEDRIGKDIISEMMKLGKRQTSLDISRNKPGTYFSDTLSGNEYLKSSEVRRMQLLGTLNIHLDAVTKIEAFERGDKWFLVSCSEDRSIKLWSVACSKNEKFPESKYNFFFNFSEIITMHTST